MYDHIYMIVCMYLYMIPNSHGSSFFARWGERQRLTMDHLEKACEAAGVATDEYPMGILVDFSWLILQKKLCLFSESF